MVAALDPKISPEDWPPIPPIESEVTKRQVFTHRSVYARPTHVFEDPPDDPAPDNETLEHLGDAVLGLCVTSLIRKMYPCLRVGPATKIRGIVVGNLTLASISTRYKLPESLHFHPAQAITLRASINVQADVFESYVAGLYVTEGLHAVDSWLSALFRPYVTLAYDNTRKEYGLTDEDPPQAGQDSTQTPTSPGSPSALPTAPHSATTGHLSLFNQYLQQNSKYVEWVWSESDVTNGKATPVWAVRAMVDQQCLGRGKSTTKKGAKNEAAKEALFVLGVAGITL